jgi:hypothetical protein
MNVENEIKSQSKRSRSIKARKRKAAINDPTIKKEYDDIEAYLSKILSETHLQEAFDPKASAATFQNYPQQPNTLRVVHANPTEYSFQSIPVELTVPGHGDARLTLNNPLNTESM